MDSVQPDSSMYYKSKKERIAEVLKEDLAFLSKPACGDDSCTDVTCDSTKFFEDLITSLSQKLATI